MEKEVWKDIEEFEGLYQVSNLGRVKSLKRTRVPKEYMLKRVKNKKGYLQVTLSKNGKLYPKLLHRLIATAFINNKGFNIVNHIDGNKLNNDLKNLEWCTISDNIRHAYEIGLMSNSKKIEQYTIDGFFLKEWRSSNYASKTLKISQGNINSCLLGKRKTAGGYIWKYK